MREQTSPYGGMKDAVKPVRVRIPHLKQMKANGQKWAMLTAYDMYAAEVFEAAGISVLLRSMGSQINGDQWGQSD